MTDPEAFLQRVARLPGAALGEGAFAPGTAVWVGKREIAHFDDDGLLDLRLTKAELRTRREELRQEPRVVLRRSASDWLQLTIETAADERFALALAREAVTANAATAEPGLPPEGAELARRRRFH